MSLSVLRTVSRDPAPASPPQALAMWRAQPGALMLLGRSVTPMPKMGSARLASQPGVFRAEFWPLGGDAGFGFLIAVRLPPTADRVDGAELSLRGARTADRDIRLGVDGSADDSEFGSQVAGLAGQHAARITRFMLDVMRSDDGGAARQPRAVLQAFLQHAARVDGCVEIIMHVPQRCVVMQGWGVKLTEPVELLLPNAGVLRHTATVGDFARADLTAAASGSVLALPPEAIDAVTGLERIFLLAGDDLLSRRVVEPRVLGLEDSVGQIRHLLPRLNCPPPLETLLRATLQPVFDGRDTLNSVPRPVRAALDMAVAAENGGAYVSGWVFDPAGHTAELHLCTEEGLAARLDERWERIPRPDVSAAFAADPAFPAPLGHKWGFAVAVPDTLPPPRPVYLRFTFTDGGLAFLPVRFVSPDAPGIRAALLGSVDLHKPSGEPIVERHLAPFVAGLPSSGETVGEILLSGPLQRARAIVVPLRTASLPRSFLASFLLDPAGADEQVVFVCGPEWDHAQRQSLVCLIRFYGLPASVVAIARTPLPVDALREASVVSEAQSFLLVSPGLVGNAPAWRDTLGRAAGSDPIACPTVLFEDRSVRFAGSQHVVFLDQVPFASISAPLAGLCAEFAGEGEPVSADAGTTVCCLISRAALPAITRAARFTTEAGQEAAFFLSVREAGLPMRWVPAVQVSAPEEDAAQAAPTAPLIDGWILRHTWGEQSICAS